MREIKFRVWNTYKNIMGHFNNPIVSTNSPTTCLCFQLNNFKSESKHSSSYYTHDFELNYARDNIVMQYTGLKDKNGVEIYEGDIVNTGGHYNHIGKVYYSYNRFTVEDFDTGDYYYGSDAYRWDWHEFEVIGNIYENPELLED